MNKLKGLKVGGAPSFSPVPKKLSVVKLVEGG